MRSLDMGRFGLTLSTMGAIALSTFILGGCGDDAEDPAVTPATGGATTGGTGGAGGSDVTGGTGGSDDTGGTGGSDDTGGTGGSDDTGGTGGTDVTGGAGGATGGAAGEGTGGAGGDPGAFPGESCTGCARLAVPIAAQGDRCGFLLTLGETVDVSAATLTVRARTLTGDGGGLIAFVRNGDATSYAREEVWTNVNAMTDWTDITLAFAAPQNASFDPTDGVAIGFQMMSGQTGPWPAETIVYIDSITLTGASNSPWEFDADLEGLMVNMNAECVTGSSADWLGP